MNTLNAIVSIAVISLCCSTAAWATQNASATVAVIAPQGCEELIITARRPTALPVLSTADRSALAASIKLEASKQVRQSIEQIMKENSARTAVHFPKPEALQASL